MFTGIVKAIAPIVALKKTDRILRFGIEFSHSLLEGLELGASVSINGVCQTVIDIHKNTVFFESVEETLRCTTFNNMELKELVNLERAAKFGDEIGGHLLSGHIMDTVQIECIEANTYTLKGPQHILKYLFPKGYVALHGVSLTLGDVILKKRLFKVHLIPETLKRTTLGQKKVGNFLNLEVDASTQAAVDTIERGVFRFC